jgi:DNA invertase Pin-like site-specific DNA recombinase
VSTGKQERAGNGLEAQRAAIETFARANDFEIDAEPFVEVESGKGNGDDALERRPILAAALQKARASVARLLFRSSIVFRATCILSRA